MNTHKLQQAVVEKLDSNVEEKVTLKIGDVLLNCFAGVLPHGVKEGAIYSVQLKLLVLNEYEIRELEDDVESSIHSTNRGLSYILIGKMTDGRLQACGVFFDDEGLASEFAYLNGKMISLRVDRIDVVFLE